MALAKRWWLRPWCWIAGHFWVWEHVLSVIPYSGSHGPCMRCGAGATDPAELIRAGQKVTRQAAERQRKA